MPVVTRLGLLQRPKISTSRNKFTEQQQQGPEFYSGPCSFNNMEGQAPFPERCLPLFVVNVLMDGGHHGFDFAFEHLAAVFGK